jgi:hypothetical protein
LFEAWRARTTAGVDVFDLVTARLKMNAGFLSSLPDELTLDRTSEPHSAETADRLVLATTVTVKRLKTVAADQNQNDADNSVVSVDLVSNQSESGTAPRRSVHHTQTKLVLTRASYLAAREHLFRNWGITARARK